MHLKFEAHEGEVISAKLSHVLTCLVFQVMSAKWDFSGRFFATSGADRKIKIWEVCPSAPRIAFLHFGLGGDFWKAGGDISVYIKYC